MSDYIYGSSLRAAKSKANYLFEGDFRRRPNQNLSGASRSLARGELLQQAALERQSREESRQREQASVRIQSAWRAYLNRTHLANRMRTAFDETVATITSQQHPTTTQFTHTLFDILTREFVIHYHSRLDNKRLHQLITILLDHQHDVVSYNVPQNKFWLHRIMKLLKIALGDIKQTENCSSASSDVYTKLLFIDRYTSSPAVLHETQSNLVWLFLIKNDAFTILRELFDSISANESQSRVLEILVTLIKRVLDLPVADSESRKIIQPFFNHFLRGPLCEQLEETFLTQMIDLQPGALTLHHILQAFSHYNDMQQSPNAPDNILLPSDPHEAIWFCYTFTKTIFNKTNFLTNPEKELYICILASLLKPATLVTREHMVKVVNSEETELVDDEGESNQYSTTEPQPQATQTNRVITKIIDMINSPGHVESLKSILFVDNLSLNVEMAVIHICNLMLAHEPLAIFNCRLLYTVAFNAGFSKSLWKTIISMKVSDEGSETVICSQLTQGINVSTKTWELFLPQLKLFCCLLSYLLPTLDDEEFYVNDKHTLIEDEPPYSGGTKASGIPSQGSFFIDKELISISSTLRDLCVGFIDILYQDRHAYYHASTRNNQDEQMKLLSFEMKMCFKALVRLVCQLHAKDSRRKFCPEGHWICSSATIPPNKAIDFELVTSQQGRLLSHMTKDEESSQVVHNSMSEIKTVLILQEIPFVIPFHDRVRIFHQLLRKEKSMHQSEGYHFGLPGTSIQIQIRRNFIYEDAFEKLSPEKEPNMKLPLRVSLINSVGAEEAGIDGGGLTKEFLGELLKAGFDPMRGFFKSTKDQLLYPNPSAEVLFTNLTEGFRVHYEFLGRILGKAIFEKIMVELPLASFFLAKLLAREHSSDVDLQNLASLDPILYKNLMYLKNYKGDVADLNLDFTVSNNELGEHEIVELKEGGSRIAVTKENKIEYVHLIADYRLNKQIRAQCAAFKRGLSQLIQLDWLRMFDPQELQILISGAPTIIDVADWRRHTLYANGYTDDCEAISTFWRVTSRFSETQKRKLLKFATSCSLPPLLGFKDLIPQFTIAPAEESRLPTASTCMNLLKLPQCEEEKTMETKLLYAIESNSGFELS